MTRIYAFEITPQKREATLQQPPGGPIGAHSRIRQTLLRLLNSIRIENETPIVFHVADPSSDQQENSIRSMLMQTCFGSKSQSDQLAGELALRLSSVMDRRSSPFLLVITAGVENQSAQAVIWAFPRDEVFRFSMESNRVSMEFDSDVFSTSSQLRKVAMFEGVNRKDSFWDGRTLDLQSGATSFWIEEFLECRISVSGIHGTQELAKRVSTAYRKAESKEGREQLFNAILAIRTTPKKNISILNFAKTYLGGETRDQFLASVPEALQKPKFEFDRGEFEYQLGFRAFKMKDDVFISAPIDAIGSSLIVQRDMLSYKGKISGEFLKAGRRSP